MHSNQRDSFTEQALERTAEIFSRYGIKSITMDDLAKELGVSKKTLYQNFADKKDLIKKTVDFQINAQQVEIRQVSEQKNLNAVEQIFCISRIISKHLSTINPSTIYDLKKYYPDIWDYILNFKRKTLIQYILSNIQKGIEENLYRKDLNFRIIARIYASCLEWYTIGEHDLGDFSFNEIFHTHFVYHIRGLSSNKGGQVLEKIMLENKIKTPEVST